MPASSLVKCKITFGPVTPACVTIGQMPLPLTAQRSTSICVPAIAMSAGAAGAVNGTEWRIRTFSSVTRRTLSSYHRSMYVPGNVVVSAAGNLKHEELQRLRQEPPQIKAIGGRGDEEPIEILVRDWLVYHPSETEITASTGQFEPVQKPTAASFLGALHQSLSFVSPQELSRKAVLAGVVGGRSATPHARGHVRPTREGICRAPRRRCCGC